jgi:hypothetical protein
MTRQSPTVSYKQEGEGTRAPLSQASRCMPSYRPTRRLLPRSYSGIVVHRHPPRLHLRVANPVMPCVLLQQSVKSVHFYTYREKSEEGKASNYVPATAFGRPLNTLIAPPTMPGHPLRSSAGTAPALISSSADIATIDSVLSCTRGSPCSLSTAANQRLKNICAPCGR